MGKTIEVSRLNKVYKRSVIKGSGFSYLKSLFFRKNEAILAVKDASFSVNTGEIVGLIGENGAGKSTLIKMMDGIIIPTSGKVQVLGYDPFRKQNQFLRDIGVVMGQKNQLWWDLSPRETFYLYKSIYNLSDFEFQDTLHVLTKALNINMILDTPTRNLSLGERMKCELVCSLIHSPKILFLDEPTIGLDIVSQDEIRKFILEYNNKNNTTIILTSHYSEDIEYLASRVIVMSGGKIVFDGDTPHMNDDYCELEISFKYRIDNDIFNHYNLKVFNKDEYNLKVKIKSEDIDDFIMDCNRENKVIKYKILNNSVEELLRDLYNSGVNDD